MIGARAELTVEHARVLRAAPASRAHLEGALARVSAASVGVPPGGLLLVRRLAPRARLGAGARADAFVADLHETLRERLAAARRGQGEDRLFEDEADMAAAVIVSWLAGESPGAAAWRAMVTAGEAPPLWWRKAVLSDARLLPRVIAALARAGQAAAWVACLDPQEIAQATRMLAECHGVALTAGRRLTAGPDRIRQRPDADMATLRPRLEELAPEARAAHLTEPQRTLMALSLVLNRRPALVRAKRFAPALAAFVAAPSITTGVEPLPASRPPIPTAPLGRADAPSTAVGSYLPSHGRSAAPCAETAQPAPAFAAKPAVETHYGGLFFVLNALLAMQVYGDFTRPLAVPNAPAPFDLIALLGRRWFGHTLSRDPIDTLLASLSGREAGEPIRFDPPVWNVSEAWLAPWPATPERLWHPAGFPLDLTTPDRRLPKDPMARWAAALALYLQARLARALDMSGRAALRLTCRRAAAVTCAGDRVTVAFPLADHPLAIRLAGLDRDPGYLPAARRDIRFVFA